MYVLVLVVVGQRCGDRVQTIDYSSRDVDFALSISDQKGRQVQCAERTCELSTVDQSSVNVPPPPLPFGRICFVVLVMRKGGESS